MNRVLKQIDVGPARRELRTGEPALSPAVEAAIAAAEAASYERGVAEGIARERAAGQALAASIHEALGRAAATRRAEAEERATELLGTALELAERILGHAPHDDGTALERRVREALAHIDEPSVELSVHPVDAERLGRLAAADQRLELTTDASLRPGEARLRGRWAEADLTRATAVAAARSALP